MAKKNKSEQVLKKKKIKIPKPSAKKSQSLIPKTSSKTPKKLSPSQIKPNFTKQNLEEEFAKAMRKGKSKASDLEVELTRKMFRRVQNRIILLRKNPNIPDYAIKAYEKLLEKQSMSKKALSKLSHAQIRETFQRLTDIEHMETSSLKGAVEVQKELNRVINEVFDISKEEWDKYTNQQKSAIWDLFHKMKERMKYHDNYKYEDLISNIQVMMEKQKIQFARDKEGLVRAFIVNSKGNEVGIDYEMQRQAKNIKTFRNKEQGRYNKWNDYTKVRRARKEKKNPIPQAYQGTVLPNFFGIT